VHAGLLYASVLFAEIGHNWGSFHDPPEDGCEDQFLMYQFAHSGSNANNFVSYIVIYILYTIHSCLLSTAAERI